MATHRFETVLEAEDGGVFFEVPLDVPAVFGKARAPVRGTINGQPFRSTVAVYGGRSYLPVKRAAQRCGFGSEETMRRSFLRHLGASPQAYRERFAQSS